MKLSPKVFALSIAMVALVQLAPMLFASPAPAEKIQFGNNQALRRKAEQFFVLGNQARVAHGLKPLQWDSALASAALSHCVRMAAEGPISHRYADEPDLSERAGQAGAHFSLIEENVAVGPYPASIHRAWMNSPHHRENLLSPEVDRVGVAVVARGNVIYAVADFERTVEVLSREQVETAVQNLLQVSGVSVHPNPAGARLACALDHGVPDLLDDLAGCRLVSSARAVDGPDCYRQVQGSGRGQLCAPKSGQCFHGVSRCRAVAQVWLKLPAHSRFFSLMKGSAPDPN